MEKRTVVSRWRSVCIVSGGLDSVTLGHVMQRDYGPSLWLSFDYGQRHKRELDHAEFAAHEIGAGWRLVDLTSVGALMGTDALTGAANGIPVPHGHYASDSMRITVVPNRNAIMLTVAFGVASAVGAELVATGIHGGDHYVYPDCRPEFVDAMTAMQAVSLAGLHTPRLETPFLHLTKADIVTLGAGIGVPLARTWSCYEGGELHCGKCGTCVERREAFTLAGVEDRTPYRTGED